MKIQATPLLLGDEAKPFLVDTETTLSSRGFVKLLDQNKALLLQSAGDDGVVWTVQDFGQLVVGLHMTPYPYIGGAAPRRIIPVDAGENIIFTANESYVYI
jgi:hypothetical protein